MIRDLLNSYETWRAFIFRNSDKVGLPLPFVFGLFSTLQGGPEEYAYKIIAWWGLMQSKVLKTMENKIISDYNEYSRNNRLGLAKSQNNYRHWMRNSYLWNDRLCPYSKGLESKKLYSYCYRETFTSLANFFLCLSL